METQTSTATTYRERSGAAARHQMPRFQVFFVERLYDGAARWYDHDWQEHIHDVSGDSDGRLNREPGVVSKFREAHRRDWLFPQDRTGYVGTCANPSCTTRTQVVAGPAQVQTAGIIAPDELRHALGALARGEPEDLHDACASCGEQAYLFPAVVVQRKWIYVLKEEGGALSHYCEIHAEEPTIGRIYTSLSDGAYRDEPSQPFQGYVNLLPEPAAYTWHFFLSPVRLGSESLELLRQSIDKQRTLADARDRAEPHDKGVPVVAGLQPWTATVTRQFGGQRGRSELVPLVDPFAWAAQVVDFDYVPILAALHKLVRDEDEQAKAFVSAVLQQVVGRRQVSENPPEWVEDEWDVRDDTMDVPSGATGANIAEAWTTRYREALTYLTEETNKACARITFLLRYSLAHRIVELACQERGQEPGFLSFGLLHWAHLLREMLNCDEGQRFVAWLTGDGGAGDDPMHPAGRLPIRNVLGGEGLRGDTDVAREVGRAVPLTIYGALAPAAIARSRRPAQDVVRHLEGLNIEAASFKGSDLQSLRDLALDVSTGALDHYVSRLPQTPDYGSVQRRTIATTWQDRLTMFSHVSQIDKALTLLIAISEYNKAGRTYETGYDRFDRMRSNVETPVKVADFLARNARTIVKARLAGTAAESVLARVERDGPRAIAMLSAEEYEIFLASRSVQAYQLLGTGARILAGPVGIVLGGAELVSHSMQSMDAMAAGDPGLAVGHGIQAVAGVLIIAVAYAECAALLTGAAVASWAGPVGWIAAGLMLLGSVVIACFSKNDLELYARHCFLGNDYGGGDWDDETGKSWLAGQPWPALRYESGRRPHDEARERWQRQRIALLRLLSDFKTWTGPSTYCGGYIFPSFLSGSSVLEIEVDVMPVGRAAPVETYRARLWPVHRDHVWIGRHPRSDSRISVSMRDGGTVASIDVTAKPRDLPGSLFDYEIRVRLDLDGGERHYYPSSGAFVRNATTMGGIYRETSSSEED